MISERLLEKKTIALAGLLLGLLGMLCGHGLSLLFPQIDVALYDWHVKAHASVAVDPSIVVITLDEQGPASCGNGRWNSLTIASAISALHRAGASIIAPAINFKVPNPSECGDVLGNAQLLEATKQAGNVVYPSSIEPMIANEASTTGWVRLAPDDDGVFRGFSSKQMANDPKHLPFGLAIAKAYNRSHSFEIPEQGLISFAGQWTDQPFPTYAFSNFLQLVQLGEDVKLTTLVQDKIILIFPVTRHSERLETPIEMAAPLGYLHANLLNTALTHSWFKKPSWKSWLSSTFVVVVIITLISSGRRDMWGWIGVGTIILGFGGMNHLSFLATGTVWPYMSTAIAIIGVLIGTSVWPVYENRKRTRAQIKEVSVQLTDIQENLVRKELRVEQLEEELLETREHVQNTSEKFASLSRTEDETRQQLQEAEIEAADARQHIKTLQHELKQLRKASPTTPLDPAHASEHHEIQLEAKAFGILTSAPVLLKTFHELKKVAPTDSPILILGETGTGKELFAQAAHHLSSKSHAPFVSVNMAAIRPELFESELFGHVKGAFTGAISRRGFLEAADHGSIFLDEVGELPLDLQAKLLRVLESGEFYRVGQSTPTHVDVRIIAATNRDLSQAVKDGVYREDLYYRLRSFVFRLPPLRERGEQDLALLVQHILTDLIGDRKQDPVQVTQGAMETIQAYAWPGNVRELRQTLAQAVALAESNVLTEQDLRLSHTEHEETRLVSNRPDPKAKHVRSKEEMARREDAFVLSTLQQHGFDMQATAKALEWDRSTVTQRLKGLSLQALVDHKGNVHKTTVALAGNSSLEKIVELKLNEYYRNLISSTTSYDTVEEALTNCRKRLRNIPERHFPAIETLIRQHFANSTH
ncbi:MAG: sigma 54-interacting transcriptional regulator [Nitrospirales bacterium]